MIFFTHSKELKFILAPANRHFSRSLFKVIVTVVFFWCLFVFEGNSSSNISFRVRHSLDDPKAPW